MNEKNETYKTLSVAYSEACHQGRLDVVARFLSPAVEVTGNVFRGRGSEAFLKALAERKSEPPRTRIQRVFVAGDEVCLFSGGNGSTRTAVERLSWAGSRLIRIEWLLVEPEQTELLPG